MQELAALALTGALVSLVVQLIKSNTFVSPRLAVVVLSLVAGGVFYWVNAHPGFIRVATEIFIAANAFYAFVLTYFDPTA